jgi:hypothetical protein
MKLNRNQLAHYGIAPRLIVRDVRPVREVPVRELSDPVFEPPARTVPVTYRKRRRVEVDHAV